MTNLIYVRWAILRNFISLYFKIISIIVTVYHSGTMRTNMLLVLCIVVHTNFIGICWPVLQTKHKDRRTLNPIMRSFRALCAEAMYAQTYPRDLGA